MADIAHVLPRASKAIAHGIERGFHLGAQLYVSRDGRIVADDAIGYATFDEDGPARPLRADDLALWLSASKPIGALAAGQLWEQGRLDIDAPIASLIPEFAQGGKDGITMRHVLTHTGGFREVDLRDLTLPWDECIARICAAPLEKDWTPGQRAGYHDRPAWYILGECIRRIDGRAYGKYVREEIFVPLGMEDCWLGMEGETYAAYGDRIVPTYGTERGARDRQSWHDKEAVTVCWPPGNGRGPMRQLGALYEALLEGGSRNGAEILQPETVNEMTRRHRTDMFDETFRHKMDWGLGFILDSNRYGEKTVPYGYGLHCSEDTFGHGGRQSVASFADPQCGLVVAVFFNGMPGEPRHNSRIRDFATALYEDLGLAG